MSPTESPAQRSTLLTLGTAAVIAVYAAGFVRTRSAAEAFAGETSDHRPGQVSPAIPQAKTPAEVTDSIAVAAITEAAASPTPPTVARRPATRTPGARKVATAKRTAKPATIASSTPAPSAPTQAPSTPEPPPVVAPPAPESVAVRPPEPQRAQLKDGTYRGYGTSRHGDIEAEVEIQGGRITSARISQCLTRYSCSWISELPGQVVARQSANVDYVSGATQSSDAFYQAVKEAITKAK